MFKEGDRVLVRLDTGEWIKGIFHGCANPPHDVIERGRRRRDAFWIKYDQGEDKGLTVRHAWEEVRRVGRLVERADLMPIKPSRRSIA